MILTPRFNSISMYNDVEIFRKYNVYVYPQLGSAQCKGSVQTGTLGLTTRSTKSITVRWMIKWKGYRYLIIYSVFILCICARQFISLIYLFRSSKIVVLGKTYCLSVNQINSANIFISHILLFSHGDFPWARQGSNWLMVNRKSLLGIILMDFSDTDDLCLPWVSGSYFNIQIVFPGVRFPF